MRRLEIALKARVLADAQRRGDVDTCQRYGIGPAELDALRRDLARDDGQLLAELDAYNHRAHGDWLSDLSETAQLALARLREAINAETDTRTLHDVSNRLCTVLTEAHALMDEGVLSGSRGADNRTGAAAAAAASRARREP